MLLLNALLKPDIGLMFWTIFIFLILLIILRKFAWKPITKALKAREESIENALNEAKTAREEVAGLKAEYEVIIKESKMARDNMLKEAKEKGEEMVQEAKAHAEEERKRIMTETKNMIETEKEIAFKELKQDIAALVIDTATKLMKMELEDKEKQQKLIEENLKDI